MLPRSHRLPRAGFEQIPGLKKAASRHFLLFFGENSLISGGAVVVSKKVAKRSVDRHLLKRRLREILRPWLKKGRVAIIHARPGAETLPFKELETELNELLQQSFSSGTM